MLEILLLIMLVLLGVAGSETMSQTQSFNDLITKYADPPPTGLTVEYFIRLIKSVIQKESNWNPQAVGVTSDIGLMQINPSNAPAYHVDPSQLFDPETNIRIGVDILRWSIDQYGVFDGLAAYNGGPKNRNSAVTQAYANNVLAILQTVV